MTQQKSLCLIRQECGNHPGHGGIATYLRRSADFCRIAQAMMAYNKRNLGEFYVAPAYTKLYQQGLSRSNTWSIFSVMYGLETFLLSDVLGKAISNERVAV